MHDLKRPVGHLWEFSDAYEVRCHLCCVSMREFKCHRLASSELTSKMGFNILSSRNGHELCLNVLIQNKKDIVKRQISDKIGAEPGSKRQGFVNLVGKVANDFVAWEEVMKAISENLLDEVPMQLAGKGIRVEMSECLRKENLVVFSIRVVSADFQRLAAHGLVPGFVASLVQCFQFLPPLIDTALRQLTKRLPLRGSGRH
mmetsp:Transcript_105447/g.339532  ORF Transcript_105447/g.339532 Transcript_105447/m.339532 type:complete len:201 (-) Transcript_105447:404-1006(-)